MISNIEKKLMVAGWIALAVIVAAAYFGLRLRAAVRERAEERKAAWEHREALVKKLETQSQTPQAKKPLVKSIYGWQTFSSPSFKVSFQVPPGWVVKEMPPSEKFSYDFEINTTETYMQTAGNGKTVTFPIGNVYIAFEEKGELPAQVLQAFCLKQEESVMVNEKMWIGCVQSFGGSHLLQLYTTVPGTNQYVFIGGGTREEEHLSPRKTLAEYDYTIEKIISTLQFLPQ